ncbi:hypothetical protein K3495_g8350 [Podosphaera aphanis]|nr:hypothetical protein K3495_g8350 [Podosphaera aphanis]
MAHPTAEARTRRSQALNYRVGSLRRSISPVSSTGSCHGTVVSESTTSEFFSGIEEDIANGDIWNSTGEFFFNPKNKDNNHINSANIRSTAKKHGRWEPRPYQPMAFSTSAIASAFPDFTSIGVDTNDEDNTTAGKSISLEISRGTKQRQYISNMASSRQSPCRQNPPTPNSNEQHNVTPNARHPASKPMSKTKLDSQEKNSPEQKDKITRSTVHKTINTTSHISHTSHSFNGDRRSQKALQPRIGDEMDNSIIAEEHTFTTTIASNSTKAAVNTLKCPSKTSLPPKSIRFLDSRRPILPEDKILSRKEGSANYIHEARHTATKEGHDNTPCRSSRLSVIQAQNSEPNTSTNPTQTGTSFVLPWNNNTQPTTTTRNQFPIFTAQGKVQSTRLPHEYVDSIDLPPEEEHIYDMIENMNKQNFKADDFTRYLQCKENKLGDGSFPNSVRKRSDSGLGDSSSDISGRDAQKLATNDTKHENLISDLQKKLEDANNSKNKIDIKYLQLQTRVKQHELRDKETLKKTESLQKEKIEMRSMIHRLETEIQRLRNENNLLRHNEEKLKQDILSLESKNLKFGTQSGQPISDDNYLQYSEIQSLKSQIEQLSTQEEALLSTNKELAARNWAQKGENQSLMEKIRMISVEKRQIEVDNDVLKKENKEIIAAKNEAGSEITKMEHERKQEKIDWATKSKAYEHQIGQLTTENAQLQSKLIRSEKCRKLLQVDTKRIMESTHEIETTRVTSTSKISSSRRDKTVTKTKTSTAMPKEKDLPTNEPQIPCSSGFQENNNNTTDFGLSDGSDNESTSSTLSTKNNPPEANNVEITFDKSYMSNFSDLLGHNFVKEVRITADNLEEMAKERRYQARQNEITDQLESEDTCQTRHSETSATSPSCAASMTTHRRHYSETQSQRHTRTFSEHNCSVHPQNLVRRHTLPANPKSKNYGTGFTDAPTSAKQDEKKESPVSSTSFQHIREKICTHQTSNCTICLRENLKRGIENAAKVTVHLKRPIPVSERTPAPEIFEDEPTIRPSVHPGQALAFVMKTIKDQLEHSMIRYQEANKAYINHDSSLGRKVRKGMINNIKSLVEEIEVRQDQIYYLHDVLEGLKHTKRDMTEDDLNFTLTNIDIAESTWHGFDK